MKKLVIEPLLFVSDPARPVPVRGLPPTACPPVQGDGPAIPFSRRNPWTCLRRLLVVPRRSLIRACIEPTGRARGRVKVRVTVEVMVTVMVMVRVRVRVRIRLRLRLRVRLGLG